MKKQLYYTPNTQDIEKAIQEALPIIEGKRDSRELEELPPIFREKLGEDLWDAARMSKRQARWTVDMFYVLQKARCRADNQQRAMQATEEPNRMVRTMHRMTAQLERNLNSALFVYARSNPVGRWMMQLPGIAHILAAGFLAYIDVTRARSVSQVWRYAGQDPTLIWYSTKEAKEIIKQLAAEFGESPTYADGTIKPEFLAMLCARTSRKPERLRKMAMFNGAFTALKTDNLTKALCARPWNGQLKQHCWKLGECLWMRNRTPENVYGQVMVSRRAWENEKNDRQEYETQATAAFRARKPAKGTPAHHHYSQGRLPNAHMHSRAKRVGVKLFLSHLYQVMYEVEYGKPAPNPWVIEHKGHTDIIPPPQWPLKE